MKGAEKMGKSGTSLQLNRAADSAIRAMIHLAGFPENERLMLPELTRVTGAPESFLSKILQELCRRGMVISSRGQSGGFQILPLDETPQSPQSSPRSKAPFA